MPVVSPLLPTSCVTWLFFFELCLLCCNSIKTAFKCHFSTSFDIQNRGVTLLISNYWRPKLTTNLWLVIWYVTTKGTVFRQFSPFLMSLCKPRNKWYSGMMRIQDDNFALFMRGEGCDLCTGAAQVPVWCRIYQQRFDWSQRLGAVHWTVQCFPLFMGPFHLQKWYCSNSNIDVERMDDWSIFSWTIPDSAVGVFFVCGQFFLINHLDEKKAAIKHCHGTKAVKSQEIVHWIKGCFAAEYWALLMRVKSKTSTSLYVGDSVWSTQLTITHWTKYS